MNLVCNILSTFPHIFVLLDFPFNTAIYILFRYETRRLFFPYLLFLCLFSHHQFHSHTHSTAPFYIRSGCSFLCLYLLLVCSNRRLPSCVTVYCISVRVWIFVWFFFFELALILGGSTHLCVKLLIGTKVSLYSPLPYADGNQFGVAPVRIVTVCIQFLSSFLLKLPVLF